MGDGRIKRTVRRDYREYSQKVMNPEEYEICDFRHDKMMEFLQDAIVRMRRELHEKMQTEEHI